VSSQLRCRLVGLTGGIGAGKTFVATRLASFGVPRLDVDEVSRASTANNGAAIRAITEVFGANMLDTDGSLDRGKMRALAFADQTARSRLEAIIHPIVKEAVLAWHASLPPNTAYGIVEIPLLFERLSFRHILWRTVAVDCDVETQIQRVMARSGLSETDVRRVIEAQIPRTIRLQLADHIVWNGADGNEIEPRLSRLHILLSEFANGAAMVQNAG
jgi:dephospho-CoA kinase